MARILLRVFATLLAVPLMAVAGIWLWLQFDEPTPVDELLDDEPSIDLADFDGSDPAGEGARSVLIVGLPHFAQLGRDYRPDLDVESYADDWGPTVNEASAMVDGEVAADGPCELGRAYLITYDLVNVYHQWAAHDCDEFTIDDELQDWSARLDEHEIARIASPVAWDSDVEELVSFDHQGEDAPWFIHEEAVTLEALTSPRELWQMLPEVNRRTREFSAHVEAHDDRLVDLLRHLNSPERIALQYWSYEQALPQLEVREHGYRWVYPREWLPEPR